MKREQIEEMLADLGYALIFLKKAQDVQPNTGWSDKNRARELIMKVGDTLKRELAKTPAKMNGRSYEDTRRVKVIQAARKLDLFRDAHLTVGKLSALYDIVVNEFENWDGEEVAPEHIAKLMGQRYMHHGLAPSQN